MAMKLTISLNTSDYGVFSDTPEILELSPRQKAIITSMFLICIDRDIWQKMSDIDWDNLSNELAIIQGKMQ